jgi:TetR/AcrR family transcriptional regulator, cholesterol catabolism regulator
LDLQDRILEKADEICRKVGFRSMTLDEISSQLSISKKTIYQYFKDKDALVDAIMASEIERAKVDCNEACAISDNALHEFMLAIEKMTNHMKDTNPILVHDLQKFHHNTFDKFLNMKNDFFATIISNNLKRGIEEGYYMANINVDILSKFRLESMLMPFNQELFPSSHYNFITIAKVISSHFLQGILTDKGRKIIEKYKQLEYA